MKDLLVLAKDYTVVYEEREIKIFNNFDDAYNYFETVENDDLSMCRLDIYLKNNDITSEQLEKITKDIGFLA